MDVHNTSVTVTQQHYSQNYSMLTPLYHEARDDSLGGVEENERVQNIVTTGSESPREHTP